MINSFKTFLDKAKKIDPIMIPVAPMHGQHSLPKKKKPGVKLESFDKFKEEHGHKEHVHSYDWIQHHDNSHLGEDHFDVGNKIDMTHKEFKKHPGSAHVHKYTEHSMDINHNLLAKEKKVKRSWHHETWHSEHDKEWQDMQKKKHYAQVAGIDRALKKSKLKHDLHVYHGTSNFNPGELAKKHPDGHIQSPAYMSTSIAKDKAHSFAGGKHNPGSAHILHIHLKKGQHAMHVGSNSYFPEEHETLLPRKTTLKVHPKPTKLSSGEHIWHAHVVD